VKGSCPRVCHSTLAWVIAGALVLVPPIVLASGAVALSALHYDGTCPTVGHAVLSACSMGEHLRSVIFNANTIEVHLYLIAKWIVLALMMVAVLGAAECGQCRRPRLSSDS